MSKRSQIGEHLRKLNEIGDIMRAMKNISLMETHKLARFLDDQRRVLAGVEAAARDFARHHEIRGQQLESAAPATILAIGSERGFCGEFNDSLAQMLTQSLDGSSPRVLVVGSRLAARLDLGDRVIAVIEGPNVVEEVPAILNAVMDTLVSTQSEAPEAAPLSLMVLSHQDGNQGVIVQRLSALPADGTNSEVEPYPPLLTLPVATLHHELMRHFLWAQMHYLFYSSLMAEHRFRLQHMESAIQRMDEKADELSRRQNILRQEEITEEIEVIMLNSQADKGRRGRHLAAR